MGFLSKFREKTRRLTLPLLLAGALAAGPRRATAAEPVVDAVVPAVAANSGLHGTYWNTQLVLVNRDSVSGDVAIRATNNNGTTGPVLWTLPAHSQVTIDDVASYFPDFQPPGGLLLDYQGVDPAKIAGFSRTFTLAPNGGAGTLGQGVPVLPAGALLTNGVKYYAPNGATDAFRTNLGLMNAGEAAADVALRLHGEGGFLLAEKSVTVPPGGWLQPEVFSFLGVPFTPQTYIEVNPQTGTQWAAYVSQVDDTSGDPTFFPPVPMRQGPFQVGELQLWLPAVAHLSGLNGTQWRSDVWYLNPTSVNGSTANLLYLKSDTDNVANTPPGQPFNLASGELRYFPDVLVEEFSGFVPSKGSLYSGPLESHLMFSRVYNDRGADGTVGQTMSMVYGDEELQPGLEALIAGFEESDAFRSALGLLNTSTHPNTFTVELYDEDGNLLATHDEVVPPMSLHQLNKVYETLAGATNVRGYAVVLSTNEGAAYGSLVDQSTGDASTIKPFYIDRTGNHPPVFEGMDIDRNGTIEWGDADGDGYLDVGIVTYTGDPTLEGRIVASDPDGDNVTCTWSPGIGYTTMPAGFSTNNCDWSLTSIEPWQGYVMVTMSDGRGGVVDEQQYFHIKTPQ